MIGALPPVHELAKQAGIDLPEVLGRINPSQAIDSEEENDETSIASTDSAEPNVNEETPNAGAN